MKICFQAFVLCALGNWEWEFIVNNAYPFDWVIPAFFALFYSPQSLMTDEQVANAPILILGNKIDVPHAASEDEIRTNFGLHGQTTGKVSQFDYQSWLDACMCIGKYAVFPRTIFGPCQINCKHFKYWV